MSQLCQDGITVETNLPALLSHTRRKTGETEFHTFCAVWEEEDLTEKPVLKLKQRVKIVDIQYQWHSECRTNRALLADWGGLVTSKISSGCPLHCFYNDAGQNRFTVALDDCVTAIDRRIGVVEEDGTLCVDFEIPLDSSGKTTAYYVTMMMNRADCRYEDAIRAVAAWWEKKYPPMPTVPEAKLPMYSFWYSYHQNLSVREVEMECVRALATGFSSVIVDDGWQTDNNARGYAYCGDWQPAQSKIPDMRAHVKLIHSLGLKYILWYSVPFVGVYSEAIKRFRDKTLGCSRDGKTYTLDPRYPDVREYLIDTYTRALKEWDLDGFKLDFIDSFRMQENTPVYREGMDCAVLEEGVHRLMLDVMKALRAIKPDILIEFRQRYTGPVMREFGNMFRVSDCPNATSSNRVGMVDLRLLANNTAVHSDMLMWNREDRVENVACQIENILFCTAQISVRLAKAPENHYKAIRFWVDFMKEEQELLVNTPITAECPQMLYPLVRSEKDGRSVIACYQAGYTAEIPASRLKEFFLISAHSGTEQLARFDTPARWKITVMDCIGKEIRTEETDAAGLVAFEVPECGLIRMQKITD